MTRLFEEPREPVVVKLQGFMRMERIGHSWTVDFDSFSQDPESVRTSDWFNNDDRVGRLTIEAVEVVA